MMQQSRRPHATTALNNTIPSNYLDKYTNHRIKYSTVLGTNMTNSHSLDHESKLLNGQPSIHQYVHGFGRVSAALDRADHHHHIVQGRGIGKRNTTRIATATVQSRRSRRRGKFKPGRYLNQTQTPAVNGSYRNMLKHTVVVDENPNVSEADPVRYTYAKNISNQYARHPQLGLMTNSRRAQAFLKRNPLRRLSLRSAYINTSGLAAPGR